MINFYIRLSNKPMIGGQTESVTRKGITSHQRHLTVPKNVTINVQIPWTFKGEGFEEKLLQPCTKAFHTSSQFYETEIILSKSLPFPPHPCQIRRKKALFKYILWLPLFYLLSLQAPLKCCTLSSLPLNGHVLLGSGEMPSLADVK